MNATRGSAALIFLCVAQVCHGLTLNEVLTRTLDRNPAIQEAKTKLEQAAGRRLIFRSRALADARMNVPTGMQGGQRSGEEPIEPFAFGRGNFSQPLFDMAIPASRRRGDVELLIAQQQLNVAVLEQLHAARLAFYTAAHNQSLGEVGEAQRQRLETNFRTQTERFEAGRVERGAVATARLLEQEVKPRLEQFRRTYGGALLVLAQSMGDDLGPNARLPIAESELRFARIGLDVKAETGRALAERPDLKLARLLVRAAAEDQRIIEAAYWPTLNAAIGGTYIPVSDIRQGSEGSARRSDDIVSSEGRHGGVFSWRVIDNGRTGGAVMRQRAIREINEAVVARLEEDVSRQLTRISNNLRALQQRHDALEKAVGVAEQNVIDLQNNLREGFASQLEYRTAENSFLETKASLLAIAFEQQVALAERDRVTGRYFQFSDDTTANVH